MVDGFVDGAFVNVVGGGLGRNEERMTDVMFDETMAIVNANDGIGYIEILEYSLQLPAIVLGDLAAKDDGDLIGLTDGAVGVQESIPQSIEGSSAMENEIIAILDLGKEEAMLTAGLFALLFGKEGSETLQPLAGADQ